MEPSEALSNRFTPETIPNLRRNMMTTFRHSSAGPPPEQLPGSGAKWTHVRRPDPDLVPGLPALSAAGGAGDGPTGAGHHRPADLLPGGRRTGVSAARFEWGWPGSH